MSFAQLNLNPNVINSLTKCGYTQPTDIQLQAIPLAITGKDIIAKAPTGTGKTAAFVLPALEYLAGLDVKQRVKPKILVLTPTRELAIQITNVTNIYGGGLKVRVINILGGMPYRQQLRQLSKAADIIVATPGRLIDYMERDKVDLSEIQMLILDEADRMLDMGFIDDVEYIANATPKSRQTLLFTATMNNKLASLARNILNEPQRIEVAGKKATLSNIEQRLHIADNREHKSRLLQHILGQEDIKKIIVFSATKKNADDLAKELRELGHQASALHGDISQHKRNKIINNFRGVKTQVLVATDVAARGIDIDDVSHVVNFDLPKFAEDYVHRIGRTGRAGRSGIAVSLVLNNEATQLKRIEQFTGQAIAKSIITGLEPKKTMKGETERSFRTRSTRPSSNKNGKATNQAKRNVSYGRFRPYSEARSKNDDSSGNVKSKSGEWQRKKSNSHSRVNAGKPAIKSRWGSEKSFSRNKPAGNGYFARKSSAR